jgi:hypothetical protein
MPQYRPRPGVIVDGRPDSSGKYIWFKHQGTATTANVFAELFHAIFELVPDNEYETALRVARIGLDKAIDLCSQVIDQGRANPLFDNIVTRKIELETIARSITDCLSQD